MPPHPLVAFIIKLEIASIKTTSFLVERMNKFEQHPHFLPLIFVRKKKHLFKKTKQFIQEQILRKLLL